MRIFQLQFCKFCSFVNFRTATLFFIETKLHVLIFKLFKMQKTLLQNINFLFFIKKIHFINFFYITKFLIKDTISREDFARLTCIIFLHNPPHFFYDLKFSFNVPNIYGACGDFFNSTILHPRKNP